MEKIACNQCGALILSTTYQKNNGLCLLCVRGITKKSCEICHKEVTVLTNIDGKKTCISCSNKAIIPVVERWKKSCKSENNIFDINSIEIKAYPEHEEVFLDNNLKGFYYPLCSLKFNNKNDKKTQTFHILSHNGLWIEENKNSPELNSQYSVFKTINNKYIFQGDLKVFKGHNYVQNLYEFLELNFDLETKSNYEDFLKFVIKNYPISLNNFDYEYYIEAFFYYKINKIKFKNKIKNDDFILYEKVKNQKLFTKYNDIDFISIGEEIIINEKNFENQADLINKIPLGCCFADEYFQDGNNIFCFFDEKNQLVYCVNQYS